MNKKIVTMGELLMRLTPPENQRFCQTKSFDINYGGAEANVSILLSQLGLNSWFVTQLPDNDIGKSAESHIKGCGVKTDYINFEGEKMGTYFFEKGISVRPSKVIYDRKHSSITKVNVNNFDFDRMFDGAEWFHVSGITPALGEECKNITKLAIKKAKEKGLKISIDLNYRKQLWSIDKYEKAMDEILPDVDLCIGWLTSIEKKSSEYKVMDFIKEKFDEERFIDIFSKMIEKYNIKYMATTLRKNFSASKNALSAIIYDGKKLYKSSEYKFDILDRVGAGDAFAAGLIYGFNKKYEIQKVLEFATVSAVLKHTISGDSSITNADEILSMVNGNTSGSVQR